MYPKFLISAIFILLIQAPAYSATGTQVLDNGIDGNQRIYSVACTDGSRGSIIQEFDLESDQIKVTKVCAYPAKGEDICRPNWNIDDAAQTICR